MEEYNHEISHGGGPHHRGGYTYVTSSILGPNNSSSSSSYVGCRTPFQPSFRHHDGGGGGNPEVKSEGDGGGTPHQHYYFPRFHYPLLTTAAANTAASRPHHQPQNHQQDFGGEGHGNSGGGGHEVEAIKSKIVAHPQYSNLLEAYLDCQKVGAPPEVVARLASAHQKFEARQRSSFTSFMDGSKDPELDQFMEAYYDMLVKYREELTKPVQEAMDFMQRIESQLNVLSNGRVRVFSSNDDRSEGVGSSEEEQEKSGGETEVPEMDPRGEDRELKNHLLKKYSGYLSSLKQELSKKKKKGKLPKDARQKLLSWWELHYKWPYPSESEKAGLAEATGLDQKQINNWFINQRKRHWKPSEDMQLMVMDGIGIGIGIHPLYMGDFET